MIFLQWFFIYVGIGIILVRAINYFECEPEDETDAFFVIIWPIVAVMYGVVLIGKVINYLVHM